MEDDCNLVLLFVGARSDPALERRVVCVLGSGRASGVVVRKGLADELADHHAALNPGRSGSAVDLVEIVRCQPKPDIGRDRGARVKALAGLLDGHAENIARDSARKWWMVTPM